MSMTNSDTVRIVAKQDEILPELSNKMTKGSLLLQGQISVAKRQKNIMFVYNNSTLSYPLKSLANASSEKRYEAELQL